MQFSIFFTVAAFLGAASAQSITCAYDTYQLCLDSCKNDNNRVICEVSRCDICKDE